MEALVDSVPKLASQLGSSVEDAHHAAVAITTTDLVSKSAALEVSWGLGSRFELLGVGYSGCKSTEEDSG